ncbi:MAG: hypothetical protein KF819_16975 [Labilithrix sp.]|nr:hypothetical protein [Labilithrix sp.]
MRTAITAWGAAALVVMSIGEAHADDCGSPLVNTCINSDTYWPTAGPMRFAHVMGTETVGRGQIGFGLVSTYLSRPVLLRVATPGSGGSDQFVVDDQLNTNFLFAYGVTDRLQLDFALPVTLIQTGAGLSPLTGGEDLRDTAMRDLRFGFVYTLVPRARILPEIAGERGGEGNAWSLASRFNVSAPTGDAGSFAGDRGVVLAPSLAGDFRHKIFFAGADLGARIRPVTEFAGARVGTQITTGLGAGIDVIERERLSFMAEARAFFNLPEQADTAQSAFGITSRPNGKAIFPAEWMISARSAPLLAGDVSFMLGGGGPIPIGDAAITVPRFRFVLGVVYAPMSRDTDGDGVLDKNDLCPTRPGERGGDRPGCPAESAEKNP